MGLRSFIQRGQADAPELIGYASASEDDREVLRAMLAGGAKLDQPRHVLHYLYVPSEQGARDAAESLSASGWETEVREPLDIAPGWLVLSQQTGYVLTPENVVSDRVLLDRLAAEFGGGIRRLGSLVGLSWYRKDHPCRKEVACVQIDSAATSS